MRHLALFFAAFILFNCANKDLLITKPFMLAPNVSLIKIFKGDKECSSLNEKIINDYKAIINDYRANNDGQKYSISSEFFIHDSIITIKVSEKQQMEMSEGLMKYNVYHYDYKNNKILNTSKMFEIFGLSQVPILSAFAEQCIMPDEMAEPLFDLNWFEQVKWKEINLMKFYIDADNKIVIIYPLANDGIEGEIILN